VFLVVHMGFAARYLLRTDIFSTLKAAGLRIVILTPNPDEPYMVEEFADDNVLLERLGVDWTDFSLVLRSRVWSLLFYLRKFTLANGHRSEALRDKYKSFETVVRGHSRIIAACFRIALGALSRSRTLRRIVLGVETRLFSPKVHADLFERYDPGLVVATSPGWFLPDAIVLREAEARGIPTSTVVLSWDNPTSKGYRGADPDQTIVWSDEMARQVAEHHDYPRERIVVAGVAHFDDYVQYGALPARHELSEQLGLDPRRRLILFATSSPGIFASNAAVAEALAEAVASNAFGVSCELIVRLHPINFRPDHMTPLDEFKRLADTYEHTHLDIPEIKSERLRVDMAGSDRVRLGSLIMNCDVLVNVFSTTTLEAFLVDRPVVLVTSDLDAEVAGTETQREFDDYEHVRSVMAERAARVARSLPELMDHVRAYLADPSLDRDGRSRVAVRELGPTDGFAGRRVGESLLRLSGFREERAETTPEQVAPETAVGP
jgi:CDP-Glycerol:Poly(glycerophosphate) glycerophosphotransferase